MGAAGTPRVLHIAATFAAEDAQAARAVRIANAFGKRLRHSFVSGDDRWSALDQVGAGIVAGRRSEFPQLKGLPLPGRLQAIARHLVDYHLILTYGRGAMGAALAHTVFAEQLKLPPLIHHEDGSDETARQRRGLRSTWSRRLGLGKASGLVVPTELMEGEALVRWQQPLGRVKMIPDGVDIARLRQPVAGESMPRLVKRPGERWIVGQASGGRPDGVIALLERLIDLDPAWHLVLIADTLDPVIERAIAGHTLEHRVRRIAPFQHTELLVRLADVVAIAGGGEPLPQLAIQAMAAGKPLLGIETGALAANLSAENAGFIVKAADPGGMSAGLVELTSDDPLRQRIGAANQARAVTERDDTTMIAAYRRLYASAMGRDTI